MNPPDCDPTPEEYLAFVRERLSVGDTPNDIEGDIREALYKEATDWGLWGDMTWRLDTVCSECGSQYAGVCGHKGNPGQRVILRREYEAERALASEPAP